MARPSQPLIFGYLYEPYGSHPAGHLQAGGDHDPYDVDRLVALARLAEDARFDFLAIGDHLSADLSEGANPALATRTEPFTTASFLATKTKRLGLLVAANTSYYEPYNLARLTASLDHVTHGRAGWIVATGAAQPADQNYSQKPQSGDAHYLRADEAVTVIRNLWDSWEDDAFIRDKRTGAFVDGSKIHAVNHQGENFRIRGPLNVARPPQGQLPVAHIAEDERSDGFAARHAEFVITRPADIADAVETRRRIHDAVAATGRAAANIRILAEVTTIVAETDFEATAQLASLDRQAGVRTSGLVFAGSAETVADAIEAWATAGAVDGFIIRTPVLPAGLVAFADDVLPHLRTRGLAREDYTAQLLRANLALAAPANRLVG